jgi:hypothetical protein
MRPAIMVTEQLRHFYQPRFQKNHLILKNSLLFMMMMVIHHLSKHIPLKLMKMLMMPLKKLER